MQLYIKKQIKLKEKKMNRKEFDEFVFETYGISADFPFKDSKEPVYRHTSNRKWFAIVINVKKSRLIPKEKEASSEDAEESLFKNQIKISNKNHNKNESFESDETIDIVNLKCPENVFETVWLEPNVFPAYHMNKRHWISVPLDGSVSKETIAFLLDKSFDATSHKVKRKQNQ
jgi:predicted DNA-binding protein (MmcQ/YjbR family)